MRRVLIMALVGAAATAVPSVPAQAALTLVGTFSGNQCTGGPITTCYAAGFTAQSGTLTQVGAQGLPVPGSPGILGLDGTGSTTGFTDSINLATDILTYSYTGSEIAHFMGIFQGGGGLNCNGCNNTYQLFYDAGGITSGTINLGSYFSNPGISHVDLFDTGGAVPEPGTWSLMLLGFAGVGMAFRRSRRRNGVLMQIA
jgi:hypothetical protein